MDIKISKRRNVWLIGLALIALFTALVRVVQVHYFSGTLSAAAGSSERGKEQIAPRLAEDGTARPVRNPQERVSIGPVGEEGGIGIPVFLRDHGGQETRYVGAGSIEVSMISDEMKLHRAVDQVKGGKWRLSVPSAEFLGPLAQASILRAQLGGESYVPVTSIPLSLLQQFPQG